MRLLKYLREKWIDSFQDPFQKANLVDVFVNPSRKEYKETLQASKELSVMFPESARGVYDYEKDKIYVWKGDTLHHEVIKRIPQINKKSLRFVIDSKRKLVHIYDTYKSPDEEFEIVKKAMMKVFKFAPEVKGYKVARQ